MINSLNSFNQYIVKIIKQKNKIKESQYLALDSSKSKRRLGWKPVYNVHEALKLTSEWYNCINQKKKIDVCYKKAITGLFKKNKLNILKLKPLFLLYILNSQRY